VNPLDSLFRAVHHSRMSLEKSLLAAQGYIELDMPEEALRELDGIEGPARTSGAALQMRLFVVMRTRKWLDAATLCERLREEDPNGSTGYIHGAFCLHELGQTSAARELLLSGPSSLVQEPTYHYNMACYSAVLGDIEEAVQFLETSFTMDKKFRAIARLDPDLASIRNLL
jgi:predicted Zn-dependent protease